MDISVRKSKKAKRMRLVVYQDGRAELVLPFQLRVRDDVVSRFIEKHRDWLVQRVAKRKAQAPRTALLHTGIPLQVVKRNTLEFVESYIRSQQQSYRIQSISLRSYKSQWGSCTSSGKIHLNYKLSLLPPKLGQYVIAHELSHLSHMNHSKAFWDAVSDLCPDHKLCRKALKKYLP